MNSNTQDSNVELASFYQNTQNGPIDTSNAPIEELNNSRTKERLLEAYFVMIVQKNFDKAFELFERILAIPKSETFVYLCFWYPFSLSEEEMVDKIFKRTEIRLKETVVTKENQLSISAKEFNTYAFDLALSMKLPENLLCSIISQGKISVKLEWIAEQLNRGKYELVESMWKSQAECKIVSDELKVGFNSLIVKDENDPDNDGRKFLKSFSLMENRSLIII
jgi:hypothetical protein